MKRRMLKALTLTAACAFMAACFALPYFYTRVTDARLLERAQPRTTVRELPLLAEEGRKTPLAAMLYAQAHLFNASEIWYESPEPIDTAQAPTQQEQALKDAGVLPPEYPVHESDWSRRTMGLLYEFSLPDNALRLEPVSGKIVAIGWYTDTVPDTAQLLERYLAYLGLENAPWQTVESIAQSLRVEVVYAPELQLYVSASVDTRSEQCYFSVNVTSMSPQQVAEITKAA